ncbi:hypothetical protein J2129_000800 [Methanofollis sp. W23]|uniref:hypothetical protein n=1 Tax=Methanofollis sp. W23 TaxID=2817849 RepID=UPI001AE68EDB|nr:hypothetical protein [Methanofollis sp. W23]MBP2145346.1 hypothetical protein [Methanofollis sp. W23]
MLEDQRSSSGKPPRKKIRIEHIPKLSRVEDLLELKCFLLEILHTILDRGAGRPPDPPPMKSGGGLRPVFMIFLRLPVLLAIQGAKRGGDECMGAR